MFLKFEDVATLQIIERNDEWIRISVSLIHHDKTINLVNQEVVCNNIDPEGMCSLDESDPSGEFNPVQIYDGELEQGTIRVIVPYEGEDDNYAGLELLDKDDPSTVLFKAFLQ